MKTIGITGGTGLIGRTLTKLLTDRGYKVIIFTRKPKDSTGNISYAYWDAYKQAIDTAALQEVDTMLHLAGEGVADKRWTTQRKREILESRTIGTSFIASQLLQHAPRCKAFISSSAIGYYGADNSSAPFTETANPSADFLGTTCKAWEEASLPLEGKVRRVLLRIGIVLSNDGGAFKEFVKPVKFGIAPLLGGGHQTVSWVHVDDVATMFIYALENENMQGIYNAVAPAPVSQRLLMFTIRHYAKSFSIPFPVPAFVLKLMLGEMSIEVLKSATVSSQKIEDAGFPFRYPTIGKAIEQLMS